MFFFHFGIKDQKPSAIKTTYPKVPLMTSIQVDGELSIGIVVCKMFLKICRDLALKESKENSFQQYIINCF